MSKLTCPSCGWEVDEEHPEKYLGKYFSCPSCGTELTVVKEDGTFKLKHPEGETICPECGKIMVVPVEESKVECKECGNILSEFPNYPK